MTDSFVGTGMVDRMSALDEKTMSDAKAQSMRASANAPLRPRAGQTTADPSVVVGPSTWGNINGVFSVYAPMAYMLPFEMLDFIELLGTYNPDYSQAVENVRTLANPGYTVVIDATTGVAKKLRQRLIVQDKKIQRSKGGIEGMIDQLLWQAAVYGAMCGEWVPNESMTDIVDFIDVNPKTIRFFWETEPQFDPFAVGPHWAPYQHGTLWQVEEARAKGQQIKNGAYVKLNEVTFQYFSFNAAPNNPYGVPPFLAALNNIAIQRDMMDNMASVVKKIALLGLIDVSVKDLKPIPGEQSASYQARASEYLNAYGDLIARMLDSGGIVHFDDASIDSKNISGNAAGATNIFQQNEEQVFSGLKSMPSVQGRSYSTTETYAGVAYDIMVRNSLRYQRAVKLMIEYGYNLMSQLWGFNKVKDIKIVFHENKSLQRLELAQAEHVEIMNAIMKWAAGITDQGMVSHELGYSEPKTPLTDVPNNPWFSSGVAVGAKPPFTEGPTPEENSDTNDDQEGSQSGTGSGTEEGGSGEEEGSEESSSSKS